MSFRRILLLSTIVGLVALLCAMSVSLIENLRALSTSSTDNLQWTVLQVETEFANLSAVLAEQTAQSVPDSDAVRLRTEIVLSRVSVVGSGRSLALFEANSEAQRLLDELATYAGEAAAIIDQPGSLTPEALAALSDLTAQVRPGVRRLAVLGLAAGAEASEARRAEFSRQLLYTGVAAIVLIAGLTALLFFFDRLLSKARRQDRDLQATTERLAATVAASLDGIVIANDAGDIVDYNDAAEEIFGWRRDEIVGKRLVDTIIPLHHREAHAKGMSRYLATRQPHVIDAGRLELTALRKTGEEFPVEFNITSASYGGSELFIAYLRDISERKVNQQKLIDARDQAERTDRAKSQFLAVMSHEMRTPLNGILGVLDLLLMTNLTARQERHVQVAAASSEILLEHVNEALDIARIETGAMSLAPQSFELSKVVRRVADVLRPLAEEKGLKLEVSVDPSLEMTFFADAGRLGQIVTNLIGNAIKFTRSGSIAAEVNGIHRATNTVATIAISDTGPGIEREHLEDIFEDFVALARAGGRQARGDGLGLSISRKVARLMGGDLTVESVPGSGSTFTLTVPLDRVEPDTTDRRQGRPRTASNVGSLSILIVEDNAVNRSVLKEMLVGFGHDVIEAQNGLEGLKAAELTAFDLIVMDISMPFMDGIEATRRIRQSDGPNRTTYILGLTAHGREEFRSRAKAAGMDGFRTKPIRLAALRNTLEAIGLPPANSAPATQPIADDVVAELLAALGPEKTRATVDKFSEETADWIADLRNRSTAGGQSIVSETLHKLRGTAAILGLREVESQLDLASDANDRGDDQAFMDALHALESAASNAVAEICARIESAAAR
ncbi:MAG: ATP-binding protein [Pseudomonadota bacterium]